MSVLLPDKTKSSVSVNKDSCNSENQTKENLPLVSPWRCLLALGVALAADTIGMPLGEGLGIIFDFLVAFVLIAILGFNWLFIPSLLIECVPFLGVFPSWIVAVIAILGIKTFK